ncbi:MAG TPA: FtsQ-type POTRA domain-containing protein [Candidatus Sulfotelmatobacter sp.]|nr:FtsQ-type POTRA domain-containing protein [Candidatus Sulfotelmatobacter sp.]
MARKSPTILQEELYPSAGPVREPLPREELDDARLLDLDVDEESPFLRAQKRVPARRASIPKKTAHRLIWTCVGLAILCAAGVVAAALYQYGERSWRFRIESSDNIDVAGNENVTKAQIMEVMGADIGRNIFFIPLSQQKTQLEQIPWVESASVMRFVPNRLRVEIHERTPVAFARVGPRIFLIDAGGTLMDLPQKHKFSFPVILGMNPGEPLSTRLPRMKAYNELVQELDSSGAHYSQDLSEVDVSDLDNIKVRVNDPAGDVLVELGANDYLKRYRTYVSHVQEWRQQFQKLESVNLRYDNQVIVNPDNEGKPKQPALTFSAARAAAAAGVKPAALITKINPHDKSIPKPVFELTEKKLNPAKPAAVKKSVAKSKTKKPAAKAAKAAPPRKEATKHETASTKAHAAPSHSHKPAAKKTAQSPAMAANGISLKPSPAVAKPSPGVASN